MIATTLRRVVRSRCAPTRSPLAATVSSRSFCDVSAAASAAGAEAAPEKAKVAKQAPAPPTTWDTIVIGEIVDMHRHPEAERLNVCKVNVGDPEDLLQIICGAPNARQGARVPVAKIGTRLAIKEPASGEVKQLKIKKSKLRGEFSHGMICSEAELGLADYSDGILILDDEAPVGTLVQDWPPISAQLAKDESLLQKGEGN